MNDELYKKVILSNTKGLTLKKYVIYGTGNVAQIYYDYLVEQFGENCIEFWIDGKKRTEEKMGKKVYSIDEIKQNKISLSPYTFILGTVSKIPLFINNLKSLGVNEKQIVKAVYNFSIDYLEEQVENINQIILYPPFKNVEILKEKIEELKEYLYVENDKRVVFQFDATYAGELPNNYVVENKMNQLSEKGNLVLLWDVDNYFDQEIYGLENVYCCDERFMLHLFPRMLFTLLNIMCSDEMKQKNLDLSRENYNTLKEKMSTKNYAIACGMGPSLLECINKDKKHFKNGVMVVCNNYYNVDTEVVPDIYVVQDNDYVFSDKANMDGIVKYVVEHNVYLFASAKWINILRNRYQGLRQLLIGLEEIDDKITITNENQLQFNNVANVVPAMVIPVASGVKNKVYIVGCDGVDKSGVFKHCDGLSLYWDPKKGQSTEAISTVDDKANFLYLNTINNYFSYQEEVNIMLKHVLEYGEKKGIKYMSMVHSNYKELEARVIIE